MTLGGWTSMILSVGSVTVLFGWCAWRLLGSRPPAEPDREEAPQEGDTNKRARSKDVG